jgi:hypothetical protein
MPNYTPSQDSADSQIGIQRLYLQFTATTAGAVPSTFTTATGITGVTKSTNDYIVAFDSAYLKLLNGSGFVIMATPAASGAWEAKITATSFNDSTPTVTLSFYDDDGDAVALAVGDILRFEFVFTSITQPNEV